MKAAPLLDGAAKRSREKCKGLDDPEQPQDEDQDQQTAKTDIHLKFLPFRVAAVTASMGRRSSRFAPVTPQGYYFTRPESAGFA
jgi:hypothetical protein